MFHRAAVRVAGAHARSTGDDREAVAARRCHRAVSRLCREPRGRGASLSANETDQAAVTFLDLLALALGANAQGREIARLSTRAALFRAICAQIRHHLANPALDLAGIAKRAGLAPRTLQTVFQQHGTSVTSYILEQRLRLAERQLAAGAGRSITEIAYAAGFSDLSYFSRAFRQRFGISPSDRRTAARGFA